MSLLNTLDQIESAQLGLVKQLFKEIPSLKHFSFYRADSIGISLTFNDMNIPWGLDVVGKLIYHKDREVESPNIKSWLVEQDIKLSDLVLLARVVNQLHTDLTLQYIKKEYSRKDYE